MKLLKRFNKAFQLTPSLMELRQYSPMVYAIERFFCFLQFLSPANLFFLTRMEVQNEAESEIQKKTTALRRGRRIDYYVLAWVVILMSCAIAVHNFDNRILKIICFIKA